VKSRIAGLFVLAMLALASLWASSFWTQAESGPISKVARERAEYLMWTWLITASVFAGVWVWLLVKTVRQWHSQEEYQ
jgi:heme/copper-type cytochrome/quinol oxidase subunit 2